MKQADDFARLMERVSEGCPEAIAELHTRYGGHIREVVRKRLNQRLRPIFDSIDFQQDVWASFFCGDLKRCRFTTPEALVRFLCEMANGKVVDVSRQRLRSSRYNLNREQSLDQLHFVDVAPEVAARSPSPSQLAMANEKWQQLLHKQPRPNQRILELLRAGHTHEEIAEKLGLNAKKVQRFLQSLKKQGETR
jgi:RNA polymerase sigma factor (sigma-70 family)